MAVRNWQSSGGTSTGNWTDAGRWSGAAVPGNKDAVSISSNLNGPYVVTYNTSSTLASLAVGNADATLLWDTAAARSLAVVGATTLTAGIIDLTTTQKSGSSITAGSLVVTGGAFLSDQRVSVTGAASFTGGTNTISGGTFGAGTLTIGGTNTALTQSGGTLTTGAGGVSVAATNKVALSGTAVLDAIGRHLR